jgi:sugar phosphate isomerase/epimerase
MIYISTGGYGDWSFDQTVEYLSEVGINAFELSGGVFVADIESRLKSISQQYKVTLHNYFPPAQESFVFNLASLDDEIVNKSMDHAKCVIDLTSLVGSKYYSFHAGYLIDPLVDELGKKINQRKINDRDESKCVFIKRVNELSRYAYSKGIELLIENNVLSYKNHNEFKVNPLLMVDKEETDEIVSRTDSNVGLLIDVAHLKVSANTLGFSAEDYLMNFQDTVKAYHLSDNQGLDDSNDVISNDSWFWSYLNPNLDYYSLEVYNSSAQTLRRQLDLTMANLG